MHGVSIAGDAADQFPECPWRRGAGAGSLWPSRATVGGNAANRSSERHAREIAYLQRKWGPYLDVVQAKDTTRLVVKVRR